jgi:hypothetical protein
MAFEVVVPVGLFQSDFFFRFSPVHFAAPPHKMWVFPSLYLAACPKDLPVPSSPLKPPRDLSADDMQALALGAWILGAGGGGDPYHKLMNVLELFKSGGGARLIDPRGLNDEALVAVLSTMGAPLVGQERIPDAQHALRPLRAMERHLGRPFDAVMSMEIGGGNGVHPMMVAALTGYPVVDADGMGRAYPELQMTSFAVAGPGPRSRRMAFSTPRPRRSSSARR